MKKFLAMYGHVRPPEGSVETVEVIGPAESITSPRSMVRIGHDGTPFPVFNDGLYDTDEAARADMARFCRHQAAEWNKAARGFEGA